MHHLTTRVRNRPPPPPPPPLPTANRLHSDRGDRERAAHSIPFRRRRRRRPPTTDPGPQPRHHSALWLLFAKSRAQKTALAATGKAPRRQKAFSPRPVAVPTCKSERSSARRPRDPGYRSIYATSSQWPRTVSARLGEGRGAERPNPTAWLAARQG